MSEGNSTAELFRLLAALDFDVAAGVELCGGEDEFYADLIRELHADVLAKRAASLRDSDLQKRREYAHLLKGTLKVLGEQRASEHARDVEQAIRNGETGEEKTRELLAALDRIDSALTAFFTRATS